MQIEWNKFYPNAKHETQQIAIKKITLDMVEKSIVHVEEKQIIYKHIIHTVHFNNLQMISRLCGSK